MSSFWSSGWAFVFMGVPFVCCLIGLIMSVFLARGKCYCQVIGALPKSVWVEQQRRYFDEASFKCRWHLVNTISGAFLYPSYVVRKGLFEEEEIKRFPHDLRRFMVVSAWLSLVGFLWLVLAIWLLTFTRAD